MTPTERAALLLKVQRALDAKKIGRDTWRWGEVFNDETHFAIIPSVFGMGHYSEKIVQVCAHAKDDEDEDARDIEIATFTFAELFPELEWGRCAHGAQGVRVGTIHFGILGDDPECLRVSDPHYTVFIPLGTPERAKRAAQMLADLLAETGREEA
jgi:hypothetical protein